MGKKDMVNTKARTLIKAYLVLNRGKKCSSEEIVNLREKLNGLNHYWVN